MSILTLNDAQISESQRLVRDDSTNSQVAENSQVATNSQVADIVQEWLSDSSLFSVNSSQNSMILSGDHTYITLEVLESEVQRELGVQVVKKDD